VCMADHLTALQLLWCSVVGVVGVREGPCHEVGDLDFDVEVCVGGNILPWLRRDDNGGDHVVLGRDVTHDYMWLVEQSV